MLLQLHTVLLPNVIHKILDYLEHEYRYIFSRVSKYYRHHTPFMIHNHRDSFWTQSVKYLEFIQSEDYELSVNNLTLAINIGLVDVTRYLLQYFYIDKEESYNQVIRNDDQIMCEFLLSEEVEIPDTVDYIKNRLSVIHEDSLHNSKIYNLIQKYY